MTAVAITAVVLLGAAVTASLALLLEAIHRHRERTLRGRGLCRDR